MLSERLLAVDATPDRLITQWMCPVLCEAPPGLPLSYLRIASNALENALSDRKILQMKLQEAPMDRRNRIR
jgi:hypothetical protein